MDLLSLVSYFFFCVTFIPVTLVMTGTALTIIGLF